MLLPSAKHRGRFHRHASHHINPARAATSSTAAMRIVRDDALRPGATRTSAVGRPHR
jgi:hypothetical protein